MDNNLLIRLYNLAKEMYFSQKYYKQIDSFVILLNKDKDNVDICGCLGPQNGDPVCPCAMHRLLYEYKDSVLEYIIKNRLDVNDGYDEYVQRQIEYNLKLNDIMSFINQTKPKPEGVY